MIYSELYNRTAIIHLNKKLTIDIISELKSAVTDVIESTREDVDLIALNFESIESIDSCGISYLVDLLKNTRGKDIRLVFYNFSGSLKKLFNAGGLDSFFNIVSSESFAEMIY